MSKDPDAFVKGSWLRKLLSIHECPHRVFTLDHGRLKGTTFAIRWVSSNVQAAAINEARKYLVDHCKWDPVDLGSGAGVQQLEFEARVRLLAECLVEPSNPAAKASASADEVRLSFDNDEINRLYEEWDSFQAERSPWRRWKDAAAFEADVDALGKGQMPESWTRSFDSVSLRSIAQSLVNRLQTRTKDNSPDTSPPNSSGSE